MAIDFPNSPTDGETFTVGDTTWVYQNSVWNILTSSAAYSVCTSSSRPSAPGEGRMIYETDTDKVLVYSGSAWVEITDITNAASNVIQRNIVSTTTTTSSTHTINAGSEADITGLSVSITPSSASSKVLVMGCVAGGETTSVGSFGIRLKRGSTSISEASVAGFRPTLVSRGRTDSDTSSETIPFMYLDSPATTSSTTYKVVLLGLGGSSATYVINRSTNDTNSSSYSREVSSITVIEVPA